MVGLMLKDFYESFCIKKNLIFFRGVFNMKKIILTIFLLVCSISFGELKDNIGLFSEEDAAVVNEAIEKLEKDYEKVHSAYEYRDSLAYAYNEEALRYRKKLEKYESVMAHATCSSMNDFRLLRGKVYNSSKQNKRIRNKCIMKLADQMEKIFKEMLG